jgi:hypothetical protein
MERIGLVENPEEAFKKALKQIAKIKPKQDRKTS